MQKKSFNVGVFGATGMVGQTLLRVLDERNFPINHLSVFASKRSEHKTIHFGQKSVKVQAIEDADFSHLDFALFATAPEISREYAPRALEAGAIAIDNSSAFRESESVPIVVPEVNGHLLTSETRLVANPNCSTAQLSVALNVLHQQFSLKRVTISTYQAVSGSGVAGIEQLNAERQGLSSENPAYPYSIFNNCLPQIGDFNEAGYCTEEEKIIFELRKILGLSDLVIAPTTVRVPVEFGHGESVLAEFEKPVSAAETRIVFEKSEDVVLQDKPDENFYPQAINAAGKDQVFVGRIRDVPGWENAIQLWIVADNLRKGAATNVVQIAECFTRRNCYRSQS